MRTFLLAGLALASMVSYGQPAREAAAFDPAGKWTYATKDDKGPAISGTMEISGTPGAYTGTIVNGPDRIPITDVLTSPIGMVAFATLPNNGGAAVIKVWKTPDGKLQGGWSLVTDVIPATIERAQ